MEEVSPIKDTDEIQAMKDYLREWNEMYYMLFITGLNTGLRSYERERLASRFLVG